MTNLNLMNGDCLQKLKTLPANSVDAIVTDPLRYLLHVSKVGL